MPPLAFGAPGISLATDVAPPVLRPMRMDVAAFVGVAPRGSCREPVLPETWRYDAPCVGQAFSARRRSVAVAVDSFDGYRRLFGGFEGPGRLPYAVAAFFEQGGRKAYVVRIVHDYRGAGDGDDPSLNAEGVARGVLPGVHIDRPDATVNPQVWLHARSEGGWGNRLRAGIGFSLRPFIFFATPPLEPTPTRLVVDAATILPEGSLMRLILPDGSVEAAFVARLERRAHPAAGGWVQEAIFDRAATTPPVQADVIEASLLIDDGVGGRELFDAVGLDPAHPRWLATVLCKESTLVWPDAGWAARALLPTDWQRVPSPPLPPPLGDPPQFDKGEDRYENIIPDDFFDDGWVEGDPEPGSGIHALVHLADLSSVVVPDLYHPEPLAPLESFTTPPSLAGGNFARCVDPPPPIVATPAAAQLRQLLLNPADTQTRRCIIALQLRLEEFAERRSRFVVLLDVPPGLTPRQILQWRAVFRSSYVAAYHPWLKLARPDDRRDSLILLNPSAIAAGMIAERERLAGVPAGPANMVATGIVDVAVPVSPADHDVVHPLGINVLRMEREGVRLTGARTLSTDSRYRQLSVRRLMLMLRRTLEQETHWMVFEPNGPALWADVRQMLVNYLRTLYRAGAFRGGTEAEAFFVRCDATLNPPFSLDAGRLLVEVGVAPSEPIEFIVLRLLRSGDRTLTMET